MLHGISGKNNAGQRSRQIRIPEIQLRVLTVNMLLLQLGRSIVVRVTVMRMLMGMEIIQHPVRQGTEPHGRKQQKRCEYAKCLHLRITKIGIILVPAALAHPMKTIRTRHLFTVILLLLISCGSKQAPTVSLTSPGDLPDYKNASALIVGVLEWQDPSLNSFSKTHRKDKELYDLLVQKGIPRERAVFLEDREATLERIHDELDKLLASVPEGGTFIFYYAGHGTKSEDNSIAFANYDMGATPDTWFDISVISRKVKDKCNGKQVWLMADCCYSGGLLEEAKKINETGKEVIAFTSATSSNISTGNWTFTQTMIDCFSGLPVCDSNSDGTITLGETRDELEQAMIYRERQLSGAAFYGVDEKKTVSSCSKNDKSQSGHFSSGQYVHAFTEGDWEPARVLHCGSDGITCELYHYSDKAKVTLAAEKLMPVSFVTYPAGTKVEVEWEGQWWPAEILEVKDNFHYIRYTGYDEYWNEWVAYERIRTGQEKSCEVEWQGQWYPARMLQEKDGKYFIHYEGYSYTWDEWVTGQRIRL